MMIRILSVDGQVILPATALKPSVRAVMNLATLPRTAPTKLPHQEDHATTADLIWGIITTTTRGTHHNPIMVWDIEDVTADHSPTPIHTTTELAVSEGTPCALLPATTADHTALQLMDAPITPHVIVAPHPTLTTSPACTTHATSWTRASLTPATLTTQYKDPNQGMSSNAKTLNPP